MVFVIYDESPLQFTDTPDKACNKNTYFKETHNSVTERDEHLHKQFIQPRGSNVSYVWVTKGDPLQRLNSKLVNFKTVERKACNRKRFNVVLLLLFFLSLN